MGLKFRIKISGIFLEALNVSLIKYLLHNINPQVLKTAAQKSPDECVT